MKLYVIINITHKNVGEQAQNILAFHNIIHFLIANVQIKQR